jgi:hypothetical protein
LVEGISRRERSSRDEILAWIPNERGIRGPKWLRNWLQVPDLILPFDKFLILGGRPEEIS